MKIVVVCQYYYPEPFRVHEICEALVKRGHDVTVLTGLPNYPMGAVPEDYQHGKKRDEMVNGVHVIRVLEVPRKKGKIGLALNYASFVLSASLKALYLKKDYEVVFVYQLSPVLMAIPGIILKKRCRKNLFLYCLDLWPDSLCAMGIVHEHFLYRFMLKVSRWIYKQANHIAFTSQMFEKYFIDVLGLGGKSYSYIPQFADGLFDVIEDQPHTGINLVFAGNVGEMQSVDTIIRAASLIEDPTIHWHIVGDGSAYEGCVRLAEELNVTDRVTFHGRLLVERMPEIYGIADAMLVTLKNNETISYTLPGKVQSYMAAGKAIIGAVDGEAAKVILDAKCGYCCEAGNAAALATEASKIAHSFDAKQLGENARKYYLNHFTCDMHVMAIEQAIQGMK